MEVVELYNQGKSLREIGKILLKSHEWVRAELKKNNISIRTNKRRIKRNPELDKKITEMLSEGTAVYKICRELKVTRLYIMRMEDDLDKTQGWVLRKRRDELRDKAREMYEESGSYAEVARLLGLDARTIKRMLEEKNV
jgi:IS30 family transposase